MKRIMVTVLAFALVLSSALCFPVGAVENPEETVSYVEYLENGDRIKTYITCYETNARAATKSGSKTKEYENAAGELLWSVTVYGTFTYNGTTSSCTSASRSTAAYGSDWSIKSSSASKSGNCATATATATKKNLFGSQDYTATVNLYCSPYGILS